MKTRRMYKKYLLGIVSFNEYFLVFLVFLQDILWLYKMLQNYLRISQR